MNIPNQTRTSLGILILVIGAVGLVYVSWAIAHIHRQDLYSPDAGDWLFRAILPAAAYAVFLASGVIAWSTPGVSLDMAAASSLALLFVGVQNAWDAAVWMIVNPDDTPAPDEEVSG